jgi:hypothetical protein
VFFLLAADLLAADPKRRRLKCLQTRMEVFDWCAHLSRYARGAQPCCCTVQQWFTMDRSGITPGAYTSLIPCPTF